MISGKYYMYTMDSKKGNYSFWPQKKSISGHMQLQQINK